MLALLRKSCNHFSRKLINFFNQKKLKNQHFSVLSSNCNGAFILHDLNQPFNSPFVNLYLKSTDFIKYLQRLEHYMQTELVFIPTEKNYPVAQLDDLTVHFMHYHSEQEAREKWLQRTARIDLDNLFVVLTDRDGCSVTDLQDFDRLPFKNKVAFTHQPFPDIPSTFYIRGFEHLPQLGDIYEYSGWFGKKYYDQFDYVTWFNQGKA